MLEGFESRSDLRERRQMEYDMNIETRIIESQNHLKYAQYKYKLSYLKLNINGVIYVPQVPLFFINLLLIAR